MSIPNTVDTTYQSDEAWEEDTDQGYDEGSECRRWGKNEGVYLTKDEILNLVQDLMFDQATIYGEVHEYQDQLARMVRDFTLGDMWYNDESDFGDPNDKILLIMTKEDFIFLRWFNRGPIGEPEPCAPSGYQGADVDAGWD